MITLSDLASFQLALMGIMVSVLTLVFAIVVGKRDELRTLNSINDTRARNRKVALENSIGTLTSFCRHVIIIIVAVMVLSLFSMLLNGFLCEDANYSVTVIDAALTIGVLFWIVVISIVIWNKINKD